MPHQSTVMLVDGSSYLYRAFHALPPLTTSKGQPTGAIYGLINMLRKLIATYHPEYLAVVFDSKEKNFRHDLYPEYKANRPTMPEELQAQIQPLYEVITAMGLPLLSIAGVEADDVIATLAKQAEHAHHKALIVTSDKDFAQIVNQHIILVNTMTNVEMGIEGVKQKFGIPPELITDYLSLVGDTSDNIPGVPNVGPKTAVKWLTEYGSLDNIISHAEDIKGKVGEHLRASLEQLPMAKKLATLHCDVKLDIAVHDLKPKQHDVDKLITLFKELEFRTWHKELLGEKNEQHETAITKADIPAQKLTVVPAHISTVVPVLAKAGNTGIQFDSGMDPRLRGDDNKSIRGDDSESERGGDSSKFTTIITETELEHWIELIQKNKLVAVDTETTSLDYMQAKIVGISFAIEQQAAYLPLAHDYEGAPKQLSLDATLKRLKPILEDPQIKKIGHNIKYDKEVFANHEINLQGIFFDTMLASYVINSTFSKHSLDDLALKYLNYRTISYEEVAGKGAKQIPFNYVAIEIAANYAAEDAYITWRLYDLFAPKINNDDKLKYVFTQIEMPLLEVLATIERNGMLIDTALLKKLGKELEHRINELELEAYKLAGEKFNLGSPKQLQEIFYQKMKIPVIKKTPLGQPSTAEPVLQELALEYPLPQVVLDYRSLTKLKSTYIDQLPEQIDPQTKRVHTSLQQAVTSTGRLSSSNPNLQNIPIRGEEGRKIREAFIAPHGYKIISADYSQIELRIMAHLSNDKSLIHAFSNGHDIHKATAAEIFNIKPEEVTEEQRRQAKTINFGLLYGMSAYGLSKQLKVHRALAQNYINEYFERYPQVRDYIENSRTAAEKKGYVETIFGRRLYIPEINSHNKQQKSAAERVAINAPLQGSAADIIKLAMINIDQWIKTVDFNIKMILQVHDELVFEVENDKVELAKKEIARLMDTVVNIGVPITVDIGSGDNWGSAH